MQLAPIRMVDGERDDALVVCDLGQRLISGHPSARVLQERMDHQRSVLHIARRGATLVGFLTTYWLTATAYAEAVGGDLTRGADLRLDQLADRPADAVAVYLAMITSVGAAAKGEVDHQVTEALLGRLERVVAEHPNVEAVLARAATMRGKSLLVRLGLERPSTQPTDGIWEASWSDCAARIGQMGANTSGGGFPV